MAGKGKKTAGSKKGAAASTVTRIKATDSVKTAKTKSAPAKKSAAVVAPTTSSPLGRIATPFAAAGRYFKGAWYELRQVRWPNRRATWSLTGAMLIFTGFFAVLILLLDALFKYVFQLILG
jgi:preprotein translocase SecE subunit